MTTTADEMRPHVNRLEDPLTSIGRFLDAIALISEVMEEPHACAVNIIVHTALGHLRDAEVEHLALFRLTHPDRERFDREGWPGDEAEQAV
jgi:hypothetical protein